MLHGTDSTAVLSCAMQGQSSYAFHALEDTILRCNEMRMACQAKLRDREPCFARLRELRRAVSAAVQRRLVPEVRIELTTYPLPRGCATTTLLRRPRY